MRLGRSRSPAPRSARQAGAGTTLHRAPLALARRFLQICMTVTADALSGEDVSPLEFGALSYLNSQIGEPDIDQNGLADRLGVDRYTASLLVERLEEKRLLERRINPADRRGRLLRLSSRGERLYARLRHRVVSSQMRILTPLAPGEGERLIDLLARTIAANRALARPGAGRRKPVRLQLTSTRSRLDDRGPPADLDFSGRVRAAD
jgi:DNA-binding MarR family transcriptional regulator